MITLTNSDQTVICYRQLLLLIGNFRYRCWPILLLLCRFRKISLSLVFKRKNKNFKLKSLFILVCKLHNIINNIKKKFVLSLQGSSSAQTVMENHLMSILKGIADKDDWRSNDESAKKVLIKLYKWVLQVNISLKVFTSERSYQRLTNIQRMFTNKTLQKSYTSKHLEKGFNQWKIVSKFYKHTKNGFNEWNCFRVLQVNISLTVFISERVYQCFTEWFQMKNRFGFLTNLRQWLSKKMFQNVNCS